MAFEQPLFYVGVLPAKVDLSAAQFKCVKVASGSGNQGAVDLCGAGLQGLGILQNNPQQNEAATVMVNGITKALYGGTVAVGDNLMCDATNRLVTATAGNYIIGQALEAGVVNDLGSVLLKPAASKA